MYTTHHPCWDAKNRDDLPEELPLDYSAIAHLFNNQTNVTPTVAVPPVTNTVPQQQPVVEEIKVEKELKQGGIQEAVPTENANVVQQTDESKLPTALKDLMSQSLVTEKEIRKAVSMKGYYPEDTPVENYDPNFINGVLIGAWSQILEFINTNVREF